MGEVTIFGDEWLERETRGKREHELALLPTGSQAVPIAEPDWDYHKEEGRQEQTLFDNCFIEGLKSPSKLTDKTGAEFPIIKDGDSCRSVLLNGKKLYWLDRQEDLQKLGLWAVRLCFTTENAQETDRVLTDFVEGTPMDPGTGTRGLYLRGLD